VDTPNGLEEIMSMFGGDPSPVGWQEEHIGHCVLPFSIPLDWNRSISTNLIQCHKMMIEIFGKVFADIVAGGLQSKIKTYGGCFNHRAQRGGTKLSTHAWGIAIDLNPFENQQGTQGNMDQGVIDVFQSNGFEWGGTFHGSRRDPMHFQFATGY